VVLECVVNLSEGRDDSVLEACRGAAGPLLLDLHADADLDRSVFTLAGQPEDLQAAVAALARLAVATIDIAVHGGAHPRLGAVDVVPFVDLDDPAAPATPRSLAARASFADWAAAALDLPCFLYGPDRPLPEVRRHAWRDLPPDRGPDRPHPTAGATCVGARGVLVAYNLVLGTADLAVARAAAAGVRRPGLRALGFGLGAGAVVSCNLTDPYRLGPGAAYDAVAEAARALAGVPVVSAELVGLLPDAVLRAAPRDRWEELGIGPDRTVEAALGRPRSW
jgi:glutamate formiminotransferase